MSILSLTVVLCVTEWTRVICIHVTAIQENSAPGVPKELLIRQSYLRDYFILDHENRGTEI